MKLLKYGALSGIAACGIACLVTYSAGCSSTTPTDAGAPVGIRPPPKPDAPATTSTDELTYAVNALLLGDTARGSSTVSTTAWKDYGFDIDGKTTDAKSTDVCTRAAGAPSSVQTDGNKGIDNSFGANILPIIQSAGSIPNPSQTITEQITKGAFTLQFKIKGLSGMAKQTNTGLGAQLFASGNFDEEGGAKPTFTTADDWPVRPELLNSATDISKGSKVQFPDSYITNGTFVTPQGTITLSLVFSGVALDLEIAQAVIVMDINGDSGDNGTIAGVIPTDKLISGLQTVAGRISKSLCGSAFDGIAQQIRQTSDILADGTNGSGKPCSAISIGLGFTAKHIKNPSKIASLGAASPDPCTADGGTTMDSGSDTGTPMDAGDGG